MILFIKISFGSIIKINVLLLSHSPSIKLLVVKYYSPTHSLYKVPTLPTPFFYAMQINIIADIAHWSKIKFYFLFGHLHCSK